MPTKWSLTLLWELIRQLQLEPLRSFQVDASNALSNVQNGSLTTNSTGASQIISALSLRQKRRPLRLNHQLYQAVLVTP